MKRKNECVVLLIDLFEFVETQFSCKVQIVRSDNAKELCERPIVSGYRKNCIIHQKSCVDTPKQNGVVERRH